MNIEVSNLKKTEQVQQSKVSKTNKDSETKFVEELKGLNEAKNLEQTEENKVQEEAKDAELLQSVDDAKVLNETKNQSNIQKGSFDEKNIELDKKPSKTNTQENFIKIDTLKKVNIQENTIEELSKNIAEITDKVKPQENSVKIEDKKQELETKNPFEKVLAGEKIEDMVSKKEDKNKTNVEFLNENTIEKNADANEQDKKGELNLVDTLTKLNSVVEEIKLENKDVKKNKDIINKDEFEIKKPVINQTEEKQQISLEKEDKNDDIKEDDMINNDFSIQENKDIMPQAGAGMNFAGNGQPFSSFMNNEENKKDSNKVLESTIAELEEESKILSSVEENIAIANKNNILKQKSQVEKDKVNVDKIDATTELAIKNIVAPVLEINSLDKNLDSVIKEVSQVQKPKVQRNDSRTMAENFVETIDEAEENELQAQVKTVTREDGIKKVDTKTGVTVENVVKFDNIIMNQADVEVMATLVEKGEVDLKNLAPQAAQRAIQVSKTLADMLAKSMENNQPLRIDFDNNISVIIKVSRDGKISAEFLPSSQIAEAYLKENLPILRQRFDNNNIEYEELSHRNNKERGERENNRKKGRNNE